MDESDKEAADLAADTPVSEIPDVIPLLPIRDIVIYPYMMIPLFVGREISINAVNEALARDRHIFLVVQKDPTEDDPDGDDLYRVGTVATILRMLKLDDGRVKILVQGLTKGALEQLVREKPYFEARVEKVVEQQVIELSIEVEALMRNVKEKIEQILNLKNLPPEIVMVTDNVVDPGVLADLVASNLRLKLEESQSILEIYEPIERLKKVNDLLTRELELATMQAQIQNQAKDEMSKTQREYFLREQLRQIHQELGEGDEKTEELNEIKAQIDKAGMPPDVEKEAIKQLKRLEQMHPESSESSLVRTYLDWMVELPWGQRTEDNLDLKKAKKVLDEDHFDLEKIKERFLEYLAVNKLRQKIRGPILCFVGPPGVGKTSLGKSIARALGRNFVRISLGGIRDEAEIRGHRRTYVGALPGRIIQGMKQGRHEQSGVHAGRAGQARQRLPRRSVGGSSGGPRSGAEPRVQRPLPERPVRSVRRAFHLHRQPSRHGSAGVAGPHGGHQPLRLHQRGETGDRAAVPDPAAIAGGGDFRRPAGHLQ